MEKQRRELHDFPRQHLKNLKFIGKASIDKQFSFSINIVLNDIDPKTSNVKHEPEFM